MATSRTYMASLAKAFASPMRPTTTATIPALQSSLPFLYPGQQQQVRGLKKRAQKEVKPKKKKKKPFAYYDMKDAIQFSLCDAMRYIRAFEVGRDPLVPKYDLAIKLKTKRDGPTIRNQVRLPHSVKSAIKIGVICPADSDIATRAKAAGAHVVGEDDLIESIKEGKIDFEKLYCHTSTVTKMNRAGLGRILGPRGLMPSVKMGTVTDDPATAINRSGSGVMYRERDGVVRLSIGQLGFTPDEMKDNVKKVIDQIKEDANKFSEESPKEIYEVVLSSTNSPGFSLNGEFKSEASPDVQLLSVL